MDTTGTTIPLELEAKGFGVVEHNEQPPPAQRQAPKVHRRVHLPVATDSKLEEMRTYFDRCEKRLVTNSSVISRALAYYYREYFKVKRVRNTYQTTPYCPALFQLKETPITDIIETVRVEPKKKPWWRRWS